VVGAPGDYLQEDLAFARQESPPQLLQLPLLAQIVSTSMRIVTPRTAVAVVVDE
jgi:hypothetical protein